MRKKADLTNGKKLGQLTNLMIFIILINKVLHFTEGNVNTKGKKKKKEISNNNHNHNKEI